MGKTIIESVISVPVHWDGISRRINLCWSRMCHIYSVWSQNKVQWRRQVWSHLQKHSKGSRLHRIQWQASVSWLQQTARFPSSLLVSHAITIKCISRKTDPIIAKGSGSRNSVPRPCLLCRVPTHQMLMALTLTPFHSVLRWWHATQLEMPQKRTQIKKPRSRFFKKEQFSSMRSYE